MGTEADVAIVGAGPVGSTLALGLARRGARVVLIEKAAFPRDKPCGEGLMPAGLAVLSTLGVVLPVREFPRVVGVRYRLADGRSVLGRFVGAAGESVVGAGVRRLRLDPLLLEAASAAPGVDLRIGVACTAVVPGTTRVELQTSAGAMFAERVVAADGLGSGVRRSLGWDRRPEGRRHALVGHLAVPRHGISEIIVTLLSGRETYLAPTGPDELLLVLLHDRQPRPGSAADLYRAAAREAHPELELDLTGSLLSAGPFRVSPSTVARDRVFLAGDAAGFIDPLTGDGITAGLCAAAELTRLLVDEPSTAEASYRRWHRRQTRRRALVTGLALGVARHPALAGRAIAGVGRRPSALEALMRVNGGSQPISSIPARAWLALAGI